MLLLVFNRWCFRWHTIFGAFVRFQLSVLSLALNRQFFRQIRSLVLLLAFNRECFRHRSIVGVQSLVLLSASIVGAFFGFNCLGSVSGSGWMIDAFFGVGLR